MIPEPVIDYINKNYDNSLGDLFEFLSIPGISTDLTHATDVRRTADWLQGYIRRMGLRCEIYETSGAPVIYAETGQEKDAPTVLFYSHYDVMPPGLPEEWASPPFTPVIRKGAIYARGAVDDKGQLFSVLQAIESILSVEDRLPLNVKLLFEGEEEAGSPGISGFIGNNCKWLCSDVIVIIDILKYRTDLPAIYYGAKGLLSVFVNVTGPAISVHSGIYGGEIANPVHAVAHIIDCLKDSDGKILIPGFYDHVRDITPEERAEIASLPFDEIALKALLGIETLTPEKGYTPPECTMTRPTLDVNGIWGGARPGASLLAIPSAAGVLLSMRLVPDQKPDEIYRLFEAYVSSLTMPGTKVKLRREASHEPSITPRDSDAVRSAGHALEYAFGHRPVLVRSGGTSGIVPRLREATGTSDIIITGWGDPGDGEHSPDEHFSLENYRRGIIATAAIIYELARMKKHYTDVTVETESADGAGETGNTGVCCRLSINKG